MVSDSARSARPEAAAITRTAGSASCRIARLDPRFRDNPCDPIERFLAGRIQNLIAPQRRQALGFVGGQRQRRAQPETANGCFLRRNAGPRAFSFS
jgi:hypothetical protein